jgi:hypothetical protein
MYPVRIEKGIFIDRKCSHIIDFDPGIYIPNIQIRSKQREFFIELDQFERKYFGIPNPDPKKYLEQKRILTNEEYRQYICLYGI